MMLGVMGQNHASSTAQTGELGHTIVFILRMWRFSAQVIFIKVFGISFATSSIL